jgi:UDP:flavonoid glycosyltransferase YjiC (YdhE family)
MTVMRAKGHVQRLRPLMAALVERGIETVVMTDREFASDVVSEGARFVDLYAGRLLDDVDDESRPVPCRYVTFAGRFAEPIAREVAALHPVLMISDSYAVVGRVVAQILQLPHVNVCSGHDVDPSRFIERMEPERVAVAARCHQAVDILRDRYGLEDASPLSYGTGTSELLNVYCEPETFISRETRRALEPIAFFGSLPSLDEIAVRRRRTSPTTPGWFGAAPADLRVYVSFGTIIWRYYLPEALASLRAITEAVADRSGTRALISLGDAVVPAHELAALSHPNVIVKPYVDQWQVLGDADVFLTHHGLNSTHEAIFSLVPMISHPFFADQPSMADTCRQMGIAIPLVPSVRVAIDAGLVGDAIDSCVAQRDRLAAALERARDADLDVITHRPEVVDRILALG